jgi:hypothetical protein
MEIGPNRELEITKKKESKQEVKERYLKENNFFNKYLDEWAKNPQFTKYGVEIPVADVNDLNQIPNIFRIFGIKGNATGIISENILQWQ